VGRDDPQTILPFEALAHLIRVLGFVGKRSVGELNVPRLNHQSAPERAT
jgi:hypothetical protein